MTILKYGFIYSKTSSLTSRVYPEKLIFFDFTAYFTKAQNYLILDLSVKANLLKFISKVLIIEWLLSWSEGKYFFISRKGGLNELISRERFVRGSSWNMFCSRSWAQSLYLLFLILGIKLFHPLYKFYFTLVFYGTNYCVFDN